MGTVQHYFKTRDQMLAFALAYNNELLTQRVQRLFAVSPPPDSSRAAFRMVLAELLPLNEQSRAGARLGAAILARGAVDPLVVDTVRMTYEGLTDFLVRHLRLARDAGALPDDTDLDHAARYLNAVIDGLRWPALFGVNSEEEVLAVLDDHLARLFG